jgi:hypothetical protein
MKQSILFGLIISIVLLEGCSIFEPRMRSVFEERMDLGDYQYGKNGLLISSSRLQGGQVFIVRDFNNLDAPEIASTNRNNPNFRMAGIDGGRAIGLTEDGLTVYNYLSPDIERLVTYDLGDDFAYLRVENGYAYIGGRTGLYGVKIDEADFGGTNPVIANLQPIVRVPRSLELFVENVKIINQQIFFLTDEAVWVADISNPAAPDSLGVIPLPPGLVVHSVELKDNILWAVTSRSVRAYNYPSLELLETTLEDTPGIIDCIQYDDHRLFVFHQTKVKILQLMDDFTVENIYEQDLDILPTNIQLFNGSDWLVTSVYDAKIFRYE